MIAGVGARVIGRAKTLQLHDFVKELGFMCSKDQLGVILWMKIRHVQALRYTLCLLSVSFSAAVCPQPSHLQSHRLCLRPRPRCPLSPSPTDILPTDVSLVDPFAHAAQACRSQDHWHPMGERSWVGRQNLTAEAGSQSRCEQWSSGSSRGRMDPAPELRHWQYQKRCERSRCAPRRALYPMWGRLRWWEGCILVPDEWRHRQAPGTRIAFVCYV